MTIPTTTPTPTRGHAALQNLLHSVQTTLSWPPPAVQFLSRSIIARGGFKALAIVEELKHYDDHLSRLPAELEKVLKEYERAQSDTVRRLSERTEEEAEVEEGGELGEDADLGSAAVR